ncbi:MAG: asparaginase [Bacteroidetes bacterium]|nr:asparaginase [Bacteroidota bacterium]
MEKIGIVIHGGAGPDSEFIKKHKQEYEEGLRKALDKGYEVLKNKGKAIDAVEAAVNELENNPIFNAGRGSAINAKGEVEMCASIMNGQNLNSGAVAIVKNVRNPVSLAKAVMLNTSHIYLGGEGALNYAKSINIELEPESYFVTEHQYDAYAKKRKEAYASNRHIAMEQIHERSHGTVGAVALDHEGNIAAATSTGGTEFCKEGRIGDSSMIGVGSYADNSTCAVSTTGDGEYLIRGVIAHSVSNVMKYTKADVQEAARKVIFEENKDAEGDMGVIAIDRDCNIAIEFNSARMHRGWKTPKGTGVGIYKD